VARLTGVALGKDYEGQDCSLARTLEVVGERWTLLVLRDCFFGVRRFTDLRERLDIPRAVLTDRLNHLVDAGVLRREEYRRGRFEYVLTEHGLDLWPVLYSLIQWGERHRAPRGRRRLFSHVLCGHDIGQDGQCPACHTIPPAGELATRPGPGLRKVADNPVSQELRQPRRLLEQLPAGQD
jgi:DNA-binding HxlR family transcriptional regulator